MDNKLTGEIIGAAIEVHRTLGGPGLLESIYEAALCHELTLRGINHKRQLPVPVVYKGITIRDPLFIDILVENEVIVEVKATEKNHLIHETQVLTYLRLTDKKLGLVIRLLLKPHLPTKINLFSPIFITPRRRPILGSTPRCDTRP